MHKGCEWLYSGQGYTGLCVNCISKIHSILDVLSFEYVKVFNVSEVYIYML